MHFTRTNLKLLETKIQILKRAIVHPAPNWYVAIMHFRDYVQVSVTKRSKLKH